MQNKTDKITLAVMQQRAALTDRGRLQRFHSPGKLGEDPSDLARPHDSPTPRTASTAGYCVNT